MDFKKLIDQIIAKRKSNLPQIESDEKSVTELQSKIYEIKNLVENNEDKEIKKLLPVINNTLDNLKIISEKVHNVRERFSRETINIGVSGVVRVGKSTVLQSLSGLKDEQIPTGSGLPVTACRSRIFNQSIDDKEYAIVRFYTKSEFLNKRVLTLCDNLSYQINNIDDFLKADFTKQFGIEDPNQVEKNKKLEKLLSMQKAYNYFERLLDGSDKTIDNLNELEKYVAYSDRDENRLYPAVRNVDIHCHFPSLEGVKVQLIDLPGFGEVGDVDKIQLEGLESDVDHALVVLRPQEGNFVNQQYSNMSHTLHSVQQDVKDRTNLMSFALNVVKTVPNVKQLTKTLKDDLIKNDKNVVDGQNLYEIVAIEEDSVRSMFSKILERMITALPKMDEDFLNAYKSKLGFDEVKNALNRILENTKKAEKSIPDESTVITRKAVDIRQRFKAELTDMVETADSAIKDKLGEEVDKIKIDIEKRVKDNLLFVPDDYYSSWEEYAKLSDVQDNFETVFAMERSRLRVRIIEAYEGLNAFYADEIENMRKMVVKVFQNLTGNFVASEESGTKAIKTIVEKMECILPETGPLIEAFTWLEGIRIDFRQSIYPVIFDSKEMARFKEPFAKPNGVKTRDETIKWIKERFQMLAVAMNDTMRNKILDADITEKYIKSFLDTFIDLVIRKDEQKAAEAFRFFVEKYKEEIMPDKYGMVTNKVDLLKLEQNIEQALACIDALQN